MPTYLVTDPKTGKKKRLTGDSPPTEAELEEIFSSQPASRERSIGQEAARQVGLTGRAVAGGLAQMAEPFTEPVRYLMNKALPGDPIGNIEEATDQALTSAGVPEPESDIERGVQSVGRFATGFAGGVGIANKADDAVRAAAGLAKDATTAAPTVSQLRELADSAYRAADDAGLVISEGSFQSFANRIASITRNAGIDRDIHPKATAAVRRITEAAESGQPIKLQDFEILRRVVGGARGATDRGERKIGQMIAAEMDSYLARLGRSDVVAGNPRAASEALNRARHAWTRISKSELVQEAIEKAGVRAGQFTGSGFENALRTQFRQIAMNSKRMRGFTQAEQSAIKKVAMGGPIDNAMRMLGKLAPTGVVSAGFGGGAGYALGGPAGAVAVPAVGTAARHIATKMTQKNVENLIELVRRGGPEATKDAPDWLLPWLSGGMFGADTQDDE